MCPEVDFMQERKFEELEDRATATFEKAERSDHVKQLEARARIAQEIEKMREEGKALTLSDEEFDLLKSFRRFKLRMKKNGEVFKWQTRLPDNVTIAEETGQIVHPQEVV
jgi:hypothetical protein